MFLYFFTIQNMYMHAYKTLPKLGAKRFGGNVLGGNGIGAKRLGYGAKRPRMKIEAKRLGGKRLWRGRWGREGRLGAKRLVTSQVAYAVISSNKHSFCQKMAANRNFQNFYQK